MKNVKLFENNNGIIFIPFIFEISFPMFILFKFYFCKNNIPSNKINIFNKHQDFQNGTIFMS